MNLDTYFRPAREISIEEKVKKSRFIASLRVTSTIESAKRAISTISEMHRSATHNCWGFSVDYPDVVEMSSDDGEPSGTAGHPIIGAIKRFQLNDTVIVVTRYFGGVKLGVRGLIEAYSGVANQVLQKAGKKRIIPVSTLCLSTSYNNLQQVLHGFKPQLAPKTTPQISYLSIVTIQLDIPLMNCTAAENTARTMLSKNMIHQYYWE